MRRRFLPQPIMLAVWLLGFSSGLPLALSGSTLKAWLKDAGFSLSALGFAGYVGLPFALKFLWAPLIDRGRLPWLTARFGQRRGWLLLAQMLLMAALCAMATTDPRLSPLWLAGLGVLLSFLAASQDIVIDAWRIESLPVEDYAQGTATAVFGYRVGMLAAGAGSLILADHVGWRGVYFAMAGLIGIGLATTLRIAEPPVTRPRGGGWRDAIVTPFTQFIAAHRGWLALLLFILLFRLPEAFVGAMLIPFQRDMGFSWSEIGGIGKTFGFASALLGAFGASALLSRLGMWRAWWWLGLLQVPGNLALLLLLHTGHQRWALALSISAENLIAGALGTLAATFLMRLCDLRYTATQYALLSALATLASTLLSGPSGVFVARFGYGALFLFSGLLCLPGFALLFALRRHPAFAAVASAEDRRTAPGSSA